MSPRKRRQSGVTLVEMMVVVAIIAIMLGIAVPSLKALFGAFRSEEVVERMSATAFATARNLAMERGRYVGIRFQKRDTVASLDASDNPRWVVEARQAMLFIESAIQDGSKSGSHFTTIKGFKPVDLPAGYTVISTVGGEGQDWTAAQEIRDATTFTVLFSPAGRIETGKEVCVVGNEPWVYPPSYWDDHPQVSAFVADRASRADDFDDYLDELDKERSVGQFWICPDRELRQAMQEGLTLDEFRDDANLSEVHVKPYGGTLLISDPNNAS